MAYSVESRANSPANRLRDALAEAEKLIVTIDRDSVEEFLVLLDELERMMSELSEVAIDLRPEQSRWQSVLNRVYSKPVPITRAASKAGGFESLRAKHPPAANDWWRLDEIVYQRRRKSAIKTVRTIVIVVSVVVGLYMGINWIFPPDPVAVQLVEANSSIDMLLRDGQYEAALEIVGDNLETLPDEYELWLWKTVLLERLGEWEEAAIAAAKAEELLQEGPIMFEVALGSNRLRVGDVEGAEEAGTLALDNDPDDPQVYFLLGSVAEMKGDPMTAVDYFNKTYELAEFTNIELAVIARVRMGQVLQQGAMPPMLSQETTIATETAPTAIPE